MRTRRGDAPDALDLEGEDAPIDERRPIGPAVVMGGVRGAVAGAIPGVAWAVLVLALAPTRVESVLTATAVLACLCSGGVVLGASNAAAARRRKLPAERLVLFFGGLATPFALFAPAFTIPRVLGARVPSIRLDEVLVGGVALLVAGLVLGFGLERVGAPRSQATWNDDTRRIVSVAGVGWIATVVVSLALSVLAALFKDDLGPIVGWFFVSVMSALVFFAGAFAVSTCFGIAKPLTRPLGRWLEPGRCALDRVRAGAHHAKLWKETWACRRAAERAENPETRRQRLLEGLEPARLAHDQALREPGVARHRWRDLRAYLDLLLELGRLDEVPSLLRDLPERRAVEIDVVRLLGDPARAAVLAREALDAGPTPSVRAQLLGALALALADLGDLESARREAGGTNAGILWSPGLVRFRAPYVQQHVARLARLAPLPPIDLALLPAPPSPGVARAGPDAVS